jgi:uncharacterized protein (UPF0332 family)
MSVYLERARIALASTGTLLRNGDTIGASNRLYYAIFDAIRAVLVDVAAVDVDMIKTHHGMILTFDRRVINAGLLDRSLGKVVSTAQELRLSGDYGSELSLSDEAVRQTLADAVSFVDACAELIDVTCKAR